MLNIRFVDCIYTVESRAPNAFVCPFSFTVTNYCKRSTPNDAFINILVLNIKNPLEFMIVEPIARIEVIGFMDVSRI